MACLDSSAAAQYVEGLLTSDEATRIEAHVADCADCRELLAMLVSSDGGSSAVQTPTTADARGANKDATTKSASAASFLNPGTEVGRFVIRDSLGRGGMGVVYRAYDPELDREVAIKLLRFDYSGDRAEEAEARLLREARAMARLSHPNVVTVYEVGSERGYVFIAMELLAGSTLGEWLDETPRSTEEILAAFVGAGHGLHAAHHAGLVHRDFKPTNVIVDAAGKAVVLDFGLVGGDEFEADDAHGSPEEPASVVAASESSASSGSLTRTGALLGTPAYMAPEQHLGESIGPRTDQWAFAVSLYQALADQHPFDAAELATLRKKVLSESPRPLPKRVPARVKRAIRRGLERDKDARFPSMAEMVRALQPPPRRSFFLIGAVAIALSGFAAALVVSSRDGAAICTGGDAAVRAVWNARAQSEIRERFEKQSVPFATRTAEAVGVALDDHLDRWAALHRETCEAARVSKELSEPVMELAMGCLDRRLRETEALIALFRRADRTVVANAEEATGQLTDLASCRDRSRLSAISPAPTDATSRAALDALRQSAAQVKALIDVGSITDGVKRARELQAPAEALHYKVATAEAKYWLGRALEAAGRYAAAEEALRESVYAALGAADDRRVVEAATALVRVVGSRKAEVESGELWHGIARATVERGGGDARATRELDAAQARLLAASGAFDKAEAIARRVLEAVVAEHGAEHTLTAAAHSDLGSYCGDQYKYDCAETQFARALDIWTAHHGAEHPSVASALTDLGSAAAAQGKFDEALKHHRRAIELRESGLGPDHPDVGRSYHNMAYPLIATGKLDEALEACQRALDITQNSLGRDHPRNAATLYTVGYLHWVQGKFDLAYQSHERALAIRIAAFGPEHAYVGDIHIELGRNRRDQGRPADAAAHYAASLAIRRRKLGSDHAKTVYTMTDLGSMYVLMGEPEKALPLHEEANNHWKANEGGDAAMRAMNSFFLAQALWDSGGNRARARTLAREGMLGYEAIKDAEAAGRARRWLASH